MNAVVIRCPNCGTVQSTLGECEACHDGEARYYCPNHTPGRWLDGPECSACGTRFGVAPRAAPPPRPASPPPATRPRRRAPVARDTGWDPPPVARRAPPAPWVGGADRADAELEREGGVVFEPPWTPVPPADAARMVARGAMGCVARVVLFLVVLFVLATLLVGGFLSGAFGAAPNAPERSRIELAVAADGPLERRAGEAAAPETTP